MQRTKTTQKLSTQVKAKVQSDKTPKRQKEYDGDITRMISTGSTLLDLAVSGGRKKGGGIPGGILVEVFGPNSAGKTVILCEIAGGIQRQGGAAMFHDPEARLNKQFARIFDFDTDTIEYSTPDTVTEVFEQARAWEPKGAKNAIHGLFTDSLAALSTDLEMENKEGDKMGMRRAKEFSEQLRKTCRILTKNNWLMVCSNQVRQNADAGGYGEKYTTPGGVSVGFYASLRLRAKSVEKLHKEIKVAGKTVKKVIGVKTEFEVYKSSIWKPFRSAPVYIIFDYGIDDVRANLQFVKDYTKNTTYTVHGESLDTSLEKAIQKVEEQGLEDSLREEVIELWQSIEDNFSSQRKPKQRI